MDITDLCFKACDPDMARLIKIVEGGFDMDTLGIKENARSAGLSKNYKKEKSDWTPMELEIDDRMKVDFIPADTSHPSHYECSVPWKDGRPKLKNNLSQVLNRQKNTNYGGYLEKKGTDIAEINKKFEDQLAKGYIEEVTDIDDINREDAYYVNYFPVVDRVRDTTKVRIVFDAAPKTKLGNHLTVKSRKAPIVLMIFIRSCYVSDNTDTRFKPISLKCFSAVTSTKRTDVITDSTGTVKSGSGRGHCSVTELPQTLVRKSL